MVPAVSVPDNWKGYGQSNRNIFFGMIEVPFDILLLKNGDNNVDITFSDGGGHVSSMILQVEKYTVSTLQNGTFSEGLQHGSHWVTMVRFAYRLTMQAIM